MDDEYELFFTEERWLEATETCNPSEVAALQLIGPVIVTDFPIEATEGDVVRFKPRLDAVRLLLLELQRQSKLPAYWPDRDCKDMSLLVWLSKMMPWLTLPVILPRE